MFLLFFCFGVN
jgi:hypothetical protein